MPAAPSGSVGAFPRRPAPPVVGPRLAAMLGVLVIGVVMVAGSGLLVTVSSEVFAALVVGTVLLLVTLLLATWLARVDDDPKLLVIIVGAFFAKMVGASLRYFVLKDVYGSQGDAEAYYLAGLDLAEHIRAGNAVLGEISGTRFLEIVTGVSFLGLPKSQLAGFVFFSWLAFLGVILFTRAIRVALPDGDHRRYDLLVFFLPTILFWPSSIGKEAWMVFMLGLASYGVAKLLTHRPAGLVPLALGVWGATVVRPHIGLIIIAAFGPAWLFRSQGQNRLGLSPFIRALGLVAIVVVLFVVVSQAEEFFGVDSLNSEGAQEVATQTEEQTAQGGSEFSNTRVATPLDLPVATVTVLFRPFPWEVTSGPGVLAALEGLVLIALLIGARHQIVALPKTVVRYPYVLYSLLFTLAFVVAFSTISNFGILVRQRAQLLPLFLVLLIPPRASPEGDEDEGEADSAAEAEPRPRRAALAPPSRPIAPMR